MKNTRKNKEFFIKVSILLVLLFLIMQMFSITLATDEPKFKIVSGASEVGYLENNQGYISKTIVDSNTDTGEITIEIKLSNMKKEITEIVQSEVVFVLDNSGSMAATTTGGTTRKVSIADAAIELANKIFDSSCSVKMGIVSFDTNAQTSLALSNDEQAVKNKLMQIRGESPTGGTNLTAGINTAKQVFSAEQNNKLMIILTDGVANDINSAKTALLSTKTSGIEVISMLAGQNNSSDAENQAVNQLFGTKEEPTVGIFYSIDDQSIGQVISEEIFKNIMEILQKPINNVKIVDYFPTEIVENFDFSYVGAPSKGIVSDLIDTTTNSITWDIEKIKGDEVVTLKYKLKLKDINNKKIFDKTMATNDKLNILYKDMNGNDHEFTLSSSPAVQVEAPLITTVNYTTDNTTGYVKVTITSNKKMKPLAGWTISADGFTLEKIYENNTNETINIQDEKGQIKEVNVKIENIVDRTITQDNKMPQTGETKEKIIVLGISAMISAILLIRYKTVGKRR